MSLEITGIYLWASLFFYMISGGADFGAGIIELFAKRRDRLIIRETMHRSTAPIWEANHMWLILAIVILFVGFPDTYSMLSSEFYLPLTFMLLGIIGRGTSYAFRNGDDKSHFFSRIDNFIYVFSSLVTPFFIGLIAAGFFAGKEQIGIVDFKEAYILNWLGWFELFVALFTVSLCGYLASVYIIGNEKNGEIRFRIVPYAAAANIACLLFAALVFFSAEKRGLHLFREMFLSVFGVFILICCSVLVFITWRKINSERTGGLRIITALQVFFIQLALFWDRYPQVVVPRGHIKFDVSIPQAPLATLDALAWALVVGSALIIPALAYLLYSFEWTRKGNEENNNTTI